MGEQAPQLPGPSTAWPTAADLDHAVHVFNQSPPFTATDLCAALAQCAMAGRPAGQAAPPPEAR